MAVPLPFRRLCRSFGRGTAFVVLLALFSLALFLQQQSLGAPQEVSSSAVRRQDTHPQHSDTLLPVLKGINDGNGKQPLGSPAENANSDTNTDFYVAPPSAPRPGPGQYAHAALWRQHGVLGVDPVTGQPQWLPGPPPPQNANLARELAGNGFHARLSDSLPLDRNATDNRHAMCTRMAYDLGALPTTSVVIVFHNELLSTLLRAVHSVLNRSPPELLLEIVLVDDGSTKSWLGAQLQDYIAFLPKVRLVRLAERSGLVIARLKGAEVARGDTITVLDSHIEAQPGWLEPLMEEIRKDRTVLMMPMIDSLSPTDFTYHASGIGCTLGFLWNLVEHGMQLPAAEAAKRASPIAATPSPAHAGGLFSIDRRFFWELGGYDRDFGYWGTENLEFSFRIWQCGGSIKCTPCSRVYHVFRQGGSSYSTPAGHVHKNKLRTAALWMDEFAAVVKTTIPGADAADIGPLEKMRALRQRLQCKPFSWFLENVYPTSIIRKWSDIVHLGPLMASEARQCLHGEGFIGENTRAVVTPCRGGDGDASFLLVKSGWLIPSENIEMCLDSNLRFQWCERAWNTVLWEFLDGRLLRHTVTKKCLAVSAGGQLETQECHLAGAAQQWALSPPTANANPIGK